MQSKQRQPRNLYLLFFTELWERFGFYTVQTILVLYMSTKLAFTDDKAYLLYGTYSALMYLTPVIGGWLADKYLGFQRSIIVGGILFTLGYFLCAVPDPNVLFYALSLLILGNGFFKPNVSTIVGTLYDGPEDPRRDGGFTIFYMGINIGSLIPPIFAGTVVRDYGWHYGFIIAGLGMAFGLTIFLFGRKRLEHRGTIPTGSPLLRDLGSRLRFDLTLALCIAAAVFVFRFCFNFPKATSTIVSMCTVLTILFVLIKMKNHSEEVQRKLKAALVLIVISVGFWALYNQTFTSLMLFAQRNVNLELFGIKVHPEFTQFFNPFFIVALGPVMSLLWIKLDKKGLNPSIPTKFFLGVICMTLGFALLAVATHVGAVDDKTSLWWSIGSYFIQTVGELLISPIGLSMITVLSPPDMVGLMMGVWFLSLAAAFALAGELATLTAVTGLANASSSLHAYAHGFNQLTMIAVGLCVASAVTLPKLKKMIK